MKYICALALAASVCVLSVSGQNDAEKRVIEVSGSAETMITPNEFTFKITIVERIEKKEKLTIEQQEASLRSELTGIGIDAAKDLSVFDISSNYIPRKRVRDTLGTKDYRLKVRDISKIAPLVELVDRLNISRLDLVDTTHSELTRLRKETKMEAIKAAKEKAEYLLGAISERPGKPVYVKEVEEETSGLFRPRPGLTAYANITSNTIGGRVESQEPDSALSFTQIKLRYVIAARFEIE